MPAPRRNLIWIAGVRRESGRASERRFPKRIDKSHGPVGRVTQRPLPAWVRLHVHAHPSPGLLLLCFGAAGRMQVRTARRRLANCVVRLGTQAGYTRMSGNWVS
jgi:hypothetical protein